ncbi:MAG TPA: glycosyltransferase [Phycisphaerales bacterium]|nr:glycosyltransferase [Phycisphaerales bacterium]
MNRELNSEARVDAEGGVEISFVVPAYNEAAVIARTLDAIHAAARAVVGEQYEVIVADDASTDGTGEIARQHGANVIAVQKRQIGAVRNAGARVAKGRVLIFVDADTVICEKPVRAAMREIERGAAGGGAMVGFEDVSWMARAVGRVFCEVFVLLRLAAGCFMFCRRTDFEAVGGFDEKYFASEEIWLSKALKARGKFVVVRAQVLTSGRKIRRFGLWGLLGRFVGIMLGGQKAVQRREGLDIWYDGVRETRDSAQGAKA